MKATDVTLWDFLPGSLIPLIGLNVDHAPIYGVDYRAYRMDKITRTPANLTFLKFTQLFFSLFVEALISFNTPCDKRSGCFFSIRAKAQTSAALPVQTCLRPLEASFSVKVGPPPTPPTLHPLIPFALQLNTYQATKCYTKQRRSSGIQG